MTDIDYDELDRAVSSMKRGRSAPSDTDIIPEPVQEPVRAQLASLATNNSAENSVERPSTGRFMDVVHPSSDMRASGNVPLPRPISQSPASTPAPRYTPTNFIPQIPTTEPTEPTLSDSPFLSGTKVEKRPLGAFSNEMPIIKDDIEHPTQPDMNGPLPDELGDTLMMIDAGSTTSPEVEKLIEAPKPEKQLEMSDLANERYLEPANLDYKKQGAIYDPSTFTKPMVRPTKSKPSWLWIVWILLLLVAGVAAGVAVYYFVLPTINP